MEMQRFINPYNFVSLSDRPKREKESGGQKYTGSITYTLKTKSPLFIPNTTSSKAFSYTPDKNDDPRNEHGRYDFFSYEILDPNKVYDNECFEPIIPGSEVRGMVRSIYETLTNSCLPVLDGEKRIGKRTVEHFKPAVLKREAGRIYLYAAKDAIYRDKLDFSEKRYRSCTIPDGVKVNFTKSRPEKSFIKPDVLTISAAGQATARRVGLEGYLLKGNKGPDMASNNNSKCAGCVMRENGKCCGKNKGTDHCYLAEKHCAHVFYTTMNAESFQLNDVSMETLRIVLEQYMSEDPDAYKEYERAYKRFIENKTDGLPVYYSKLNDVDYVMLSPACITREVYKNTVNTVVGAYKKCNSKERKLCPACSLFGIVNSDVCQGSKIRFTDLTPVKQAADNKEYYGRLLTLDPLAIPHPENTEFYLKKPVDPDGEVWFWTYDYYTVKKENGQVVVKSYQPEISGRKFYWNNLSEIRVCDKKTALNRTVRALRPGVEFTGKVYFDGISDKQLRQLIYILTYTSDGKHGYKLGTGKPLGLGSVELCVNGPGDIAIRTFDENGYNYVQKEDPRKIQSCTFEELGLDTRVETSFELITRYLDAEAMAGIHYPKTGAAKDEEGFQWFMQNKLHHKINAREFRNSKKCIIIEGADSSPQTRMQTELRNSLPQLDEGKIPWIKAGNTSSHAGNTSPRIAGEIKFYDADKGFGYIAVEGSRDYRVSINPQNTEIRPRDLKKGCRVTFIPKKENGRNVAEQCRLER